VSDESLKRKIARRGPALAAALAIGVAGVGWAGCGDDDDGTTNGVQDQIEQGAEDAREGIEEGAEDAREGIEEGFDDAREGIEEGADEAEDETR
jgi:hypothetical protein